MFLNWFIKILNKKPSVSFKVLSTCTNTIPLLKTLFKVVFCDGRRHLRRFFLHFSNVGKLISFRVPVHSGGKNHKGQGRLKSSSRKILCVLSRPRSSQLDNFIHTSWIVSLDSMRGRSTSILRYGLSYPY